jgi:hypothetical protein
MDKNKKPNIFWFIIDSVRYYDSGLDDRDRILVFDELAKDSVEFTNCITSAPSTLLSAGAMFTAMPSIYVARHYNDWKFKKSNLSTLAKLTNEHGYHSLPIFNSRLQREMFHFLAPSLTNEVLPKGYKLSDYVWRNVDITNVFEHILKEDIEDEPFCFTFWYDVRRDPNTNEHVTKAIDLIKEKGYYDNSIIIMHSDHGYPDPSTRLNEEFFKNIGHDMILTDDNIKVPFVIKYPNCPIGKKVDNVVGLIDVLPTVYDILHIDYNIINKEYQGKSIIPIIEEGINDNRIIRSDTRLFMDKGKVTSLRSDKYKYQYFADEGHEIIYDMINDKKERLNIIFSEKKNIKKEISFFKEYLNVNEKDIVDFHRKELIINFQRNFEQLSRKYKGKELVIDIVTSAPFDLINQLIESVNKNFNAVVRIISTQTLFEKEKEIYFIKELSKREIISLNLKRSDMVLYLTENSKRVFLKKEYIEAVKSFNSKEKILINYNFERFNYFSTKWGSSIVKLFFDWEQKSFFYKQEPLYFFKDIAFFLKMVFFYVFKKQNKDVMSAKEISEMRDANIKSTKKRVVVLSKAELNKEFGKLITRE